MRTLGYRYVAGMYLHDGLFEGLSGDHIAFCLCFAGAVCIVLVPAHVYVWVYHIAYRLLHIALFVVQCAAVLGL